MLTSQDLQRFINQQQIAAEILPMSEDTPTVPDAARALGVKEEQIIKSLVFLVAKYPTGDGQPVLVIANGTGRVDDRLVAHHFGVGRKKVKMVSPEQALEITGYAVGAMPPFGNLYEMDTIVDEALAKDHEIAFNAGTHTELIRMAYSDFDRLVQPKLLKG